ncbi:signal recognition particle 54 kDa protein 2, partial [Tanacetum coccineum]
MDHQERLVENYTMRNMYENIQDVLFNQVLKMEPGSSRKVQPEGWEKVAYAQITKYLRIMDSMTSEAHATPATILELDTTDQKLMNKSRMKRIARGSGCQVTEVVEMFHFKPFFSHYLGEGDLSRFLNWFKKTVKVDQHTELKTVKVDQHTELQEKQLEGNFTLRSMQQLYKNILDMRLPSQ